MKGKVNMLTIIGVIVYVVYALINRFIFEIPDILAIPIIILGIIFILTGIVRTSKNNTAK